MEYRHRGYTQADREADDLDRQLKAAKAAHLDRQIDTYRTPRALRWDPHDYELSAREILAYNAGEGLPKEPHPLTTQRLQSRGQWRTLDLARDILAASWGDHVLAMDERQIHAHAIGSHVISDLYAETANVRVLRRQPRLLDKVTRWTRPLELRNYLPTTAAIFELEGGVAEATTQIQEWSTVTPVASGEAIALRTAPIRLRFSEQMIVNDDIGAVTAILDAVIHGAAQHELAAAFGVLTANGTMADGQPLFGDSNSIPSGAYAEPTINNALALLRAQTVNGAGADIEPYAVICSAQHEGTMRKLLLEMGGPDWLPLISTSYLTGETFFIISDPAIYPVVTRATMAGSNGASLRFQAGALLGTEGSRDATIGGLHTYEYKATSRTGIVRVVIE